MAEVINIALIVIGGLVFFLGVISQRIKEWNLSEPLLALVIGVLLSLAFETLDLRLLNPLLLEEAPRLALAVGVMGVALRVPSSYIIKNWRSIAAMLGIVMPFMWVMNSLLTYWLLDFSFLTALILGAIMTPTDPVLAITIVSGQIAKDNLPERLRDLISVESGSNDGLAYPFVMLPILWMTHRPEEALNRWVIYTIFWEVGAAIVLGALIGYTSGHLLRRAQSKRAIDLPSYTAYTLALTFLTLGGVKLIGSDGILAVFVAGIFFGMTSTDEERRDEERIVEGADRFFSRFLYLPCWAWSSHGRNG
ncbi:cation:proton antiporter domain-containing protein [Methanosarcina horonobensis]|uniref:cation:proton antiporter domain-containing protein n=1 Tax=Methanosarcina horonobensis TaxID=418008 RepID=UPI000B222039|nr:cation:proton antiporter [Methanosarcina horonobensis]